MNEKVKEVELGLRLDKLLSSIEYWSTITARDIIPTIMFQKAEHSVELSELYLKELNATPVDQDNSHLVFRWAIDLRDFLVLLRDALLSEVKYNQYLQDGKPTKADFKEELIKLISNASHETIKRCTLLQEDEILLKESKHQISPLKAIIEQVENLQIQIKKVYRSHDKVNEIRINLESFHRDFNMQFQKQLGIVHDVLHQVEVVSSGMKTIYPTASKKEIEEVIAQINNATAVLDDEHGVESLKIIRYPEDTQINIPIDVVNGTLIMKNINLQPEVSKWFSSHIYPQVIELESKRNLALDQSMNHLHQIRVKLAALILNDKVSYDLKGTGILTEIQDLNKNYIAPLQHEEKENTKKVEDYISLELYASSVYDKEHLFLPSEGSSQIQDISRDAQKRLLTKYKTYKNNAYAWFRDLVSKYIEIDRVPFNAYISNKLAVNKDDDRLSLFLKKGYLGKSFTVERQNLTGPIINDYNLWREGFSGAVLIHGASGSGKSTLLGMLAQEGVKGEFINLKAGDPYFTYNQTFKGTYDIERSIQNVARAYFGKKIVIAIDDLEQWHSNTLSLFDNLVKLVDCMHIYKKDIFFIVTCGKFLKERMANFRDLDSIFSSLIHVDKMSNAGIRNCLQLRHKALPELGLSDKEHENTMGDIIRISGGNVGHALLEYCRFFARSYNPNLKSQDFNQMIKEHRTIIRYLLSYHSKRVNDLATYLNEVDQGKFREEIDYLVGHKVLLAPRNGIITLNPLLIYSIEKALI